MGDMSIWPEQKHAWIGIHGDSNGLVNMAFLGTILVYIMMGFSMGNRFQMAELQLGEFFWWEKISKKNTDMMAIHHKYLLGIGKKGVCVYIYIQHVYRTNKIGVGLGVGRFGLTAWQFANVKIRHPSREIEVFMVTLNWWIVLGLGTGIFMGLFFDGHGESIWFSWGKSNLHMLDPDGFWDARVEIDHGFTMVNGEKRWMNFWSVKSQTGLSWLFPMGTHWGLSTSRVCG